MALDEDQADLAQAGNPLGERRRRAPPAGRQAQPLPPEPPAPAGTTAPPAPVVPAKGKPRGRRRLVLLAVLAAAAAYGGHVGYDWWTEGRFLVGTDDAYVHADMTTLAAKIAGYVATVEVENNQAVRAGDVIARIDDGDYRLAVAAARDRLATQESSIERIGRQVDAARANVLGARAELDAARAGAVRAAADYERQQQLSRADFASRARFDAATADRDRAAAAVKSAEAALAAADAQVEVLRAQRVEAERTAAELRTAAQQAERDLSFTVVRAPYDGVVGNKAVQVGSYVEEGTRLAALVPLASVYVDANFKETQLERIRPGQVAHLAVDAFSSRTIEGRVESIAPASGSMFSLLPPENATGNFTKIVQRVPVRIAVPREVLDQGLLRPGLSVVVEVDTRPPPAAAAVP